MGSGGGEKTGNGRSSSLSSCPSPHKGSFVRTAKAQRKKRGEDFPSLPLLEIKPTSAVTRSLFCRLALNPFLEENKKDFV